MDRYWLSTESDTLLNNKFQLFCDKKNHQLKPAMSLMTHLIIYAFDQKQTWLVEWYDFSMALGNIISRVFLKFIWNLTLFHGV